VFVEGGRLCHGTMAQWPVQAWSRVDDDSAVAVDRQTETVRGERQYRVN